MASEERATAASSARMRSGGAAGEIAYSETVKAWDMPTRLFHWAFVLLIALAWVSRKYSESLTWHTWNGYLILILLVFRLLWGFVGGSTARFSSFVPGPVTAAIYGKDFLLRRPRYFLGHNPLGSLMVYALLLIVATQAIFGLFSYDDHDSIAGGPLSGKVSETWVAFFTRWHIRIFDYILIMIGLHVFASLLYYVWKRENLPKAMITGRKPRLPYEDEAEARFGNGALALVCLALAAGIVLGGIWLAGGKVF